ncbi:hypothetical protein E8E13_008006 [Curvularia kusanoi]|uniref:Uncharacterized protein n=1 Tax=Curvularia kusanoi TaxID=90978 RepID=A0A9P4W7M1_CURKU|nr:hypothetical protein E8E13_008006 [Curvularia kusanoi]
MKDFRNSSGAAAVQQPADKVANRVLRLWSAAAYCKPTKTVQREAYVPEAGQRERAMVLVKKSGFGKQTAEYGRSSQCAEDTIEEAPVPPKREREHRLELPQRPNVRSRDGTLREHMRAPKQRSER